MGFLDNILNMGRKVANTFGIDIQGDNKQETLPPTAGTAEATAAPEQPKQELGSPFQNRFESQKEQPKPEPTKVPEIETPQADIDAKQNQKESNIPQQPKWYDKIKDIVMPDFSVTDLFKKDARTPENIVTNIKNIASLDPTIVQPIKQAKNIFDSIYTWADKRINTTKDQDKVYYDTMDDINENANFDLKETRGLIPIDLSFSSQGAQETLKRFTKDIEDLEKPMHDIVAPYLKGEVDVSTPEGQQQIAVMRAKMDILTNDKLKKYSKDGQTLTYDDYIYAANKLQGMGQSLKDIEMKYNPKVAKEQEKAMKEFKLMVPNTLLNEIDSRGGDIVSDVSLIEKSNNIESYLINEWSKITHSGREDISKESQDDIKADYVDYANKLIKAYAMSEMGATTEDIVKEVGRGPGGEQWLDTQQQMDPKKYGLERKAVFQKGGAGVSIDNFEQLQDRVAEEARQAFYNKMDRYNVADLKNAAMYLVQAGPADRLHKATERGGMNQGTAAELGFFYTDGKLPWKTDSAWTRFSNKTSNRLSSALEIATIVYGTYLLGAAGGAAAESIAGTMGAGLARRGGATALETAFDYVVTNSILQDSWVDGFMKRSAPETPTTRENQYLNLGFNILGSAAHGLSTARNVANISSTATDLGFNEYATILEKVYDIKPTWNNVKAYEQIFKQAQNIVLQIAKDDPENAGMLLKNSIVKADIIDVYKNTIVNNYNKYLVQFDGDIKKAQQAAINDFNNEMRSKDYAGKIQDGKPVPDFLAELLGKPLITNRLQGAPTMERITKGVYGDFGKDTIEDSIKQLLPNEYLPKKAVAYSDYIDVTAADTRDSILKKITNAGFKDQKMQNLLQTKNFFGMSVYFDQTGKVNKNGLRVLTTKGFDYKAELELLRENDLRLRTELVTNESPTRVAEKVNGKIKFTKATNEQIDNLDVPLYKMDGKVLVPYTTQQPTGKIIDGTMEYKKGKTEFIVSSKTEGTTISIEGKEYFKDPVTIDKVISEKPIYNKKITTQEAKNIYLDSLSPVDRKIMEQSKLYEAGMDVLDEFTCVK